MNNLNIDMFAILIFLTNACMIWGVSMYFSSKREVMRLEKKVDALQRSLDELLK